VNDNAKTETETVKLQKVVLKKPHRHAGKLYPVGASIEVHEADRAWLERKEIIDKPGAAIAPPSTKASLAS
jgi:hypothetical protein